MPNEQYLDTLTFSHQLYDALPRELEFRATTITEAEAWQQVLRVKLIELVGSFPSTKCDLQRKPMPSMKLNIGSLCN